MTSENYSLPTQPVRRVRRRRSGGCVTYIALIAVIFSLCGTIYVLFVPPQLNILVLGVDARPGEGYVTRTDSVMLIGVQPRRFHTTILSIPRDLFIDTPGYGLQRINTINVLGEMETEGRGPALLGEAITQSFGYTADLYVRLNFNAFVELIDAVGGVDINVERRIVDTLYPTADGGVETVTFEVGYQHMDGETALKYARTRHSDDDYYRAGRQQQVVDAVMGKLANPLVWIPAFSAITRNIDTNLNLFDYLSLAPAVIVGGRERFVIDRDYITPISGGAAPDYAKLLPMLQGKFD